MFSFLVLVEMDLQTLFLIIKKSIWINFNTFKITQNVAFEILNTVFKSIS